MKQIAKTKKSAGMRFKMFIYLAIFTAIVLAVIAVFQTVLLEKIYRATVFNRTKEIAKEISALDSNSPDFESRVYDIATKNDSCISVYNVVGNRGTPIVTAHTRQFCAIHADYGDTGVIGSLYANAENKKVYVQSLKRENIDENENVLAAVKINEDGYDVLTVVNAVILPVNTAAETLRWQLIYVSAILLVVSALLAFVISGRVTKPVTRMNEEAKRLAMGNYNVDFNGGGFRETEELGNTLNYAAEELSKLDSMQKELIANISHDLRTPLTMIRGYGEVMRDIPGEMTGENMQVIIDETARLSSLVNDMLDMSRLSGGERKIQKSIFSLTDAVKQTIGRYSKLCENDGYTLTFSCDREVYVEADEILILQVVYNLVSNAINYTGEDKKVYIIQEAKNGICRISVSDTGEGIPEDKLQNIWDRYYRAGNYHKRAVTGTGLGLSIVKKALLLHGADFGVSSTVGEGSTFWFELPIREP